MIRRGTPRWSKESLDKNARHAKLNKIISVKTKIGEKKQKHNIYQYATVHNAKHAYYIYMNEINNSDGFKARII